MDVPEVKPVRLTEEEATLRQQMEDDFANSRPYSGQYANRLLESLRNRNAIPQSRIDILTKPYLGGRGKSHLDVFERNNRSGKPIAELATFAGVPHFSRSLREVGFFGDALPTLAPKA